jgi:hypothetical protein
MEWPEICNIPLEEMAAVSGRRRTKSGCMITFLPDVCFQFIIKVIKKQEDKLYQNPNYFRLLTKPSPIPVPSASIYTYRRQDYTNTGLLC